MPENEPSIKFFGEMDINPKIGTISSEYPMWYSKAHMEELADSISSLERQIDNGSFPRDREGEMRAELKKFKERYHKIESSVPKMSGVEKDKFAKLRKEMGKEIAAGLFTRSQMMKGTVDPQVEADRMVLPKIPVKPEYEELIRASNIKPRDGKISRDELSKVWKLVGRTLNLNGGDEDLNTEVLRRD